MPMSGGFTGGESMNHFDANGFAGVMGSVARAILGEPTECHQAKGELRFGKRGSLAVHLGTGTFYDHEAGVGGGVLDFVQQRMNTDKAGAVAWLQEQGHIEKQEPKQKPKIVTTYTYTDARGDSLFQVVRYDPKDFRQRHSDGRGGWIWNMKGVPRVLYRLPAITGLAPGSRVYVVEGEKAADELAALGLTATCSPMGANKWQSEYGACLRDLAVVILPDNDEPGRKHAMHVAHQLKGIACSVRTLPLRGLPSKGDVSDWLAKDGTAEKLEKLADKCPDMHQAEPEDRTAEDIHQDDPPPPQEADLEATIAQLAALPLARYEQARQAEAKRLNLRASILDKLVAQARPVDAQDNHQGRALSLPVPEPWPEPVNGEQLLYELRDFFAKHAFLQTGAPYALTLWTMHTYAFEVFTHSPRLHVRGIVKNSGKTTVLELIEMVCCRALPAANVTSAAMFRTIEMAKPTLLLDEADTFLNEAEELRGIVNAGHKRGGQVLRTVGDDHTPRLFTVFSPVAIAGIGDLPGTIADRSIPIPMKRALKAELPSPITKQTNAKAAELARKIARWNIDHETELSDADPDMGELFNRQADNWRPLFAIADAAGGKWPELVRKTAKALIVTDDGAETLDIKLLADIRAVFTNDTLKNVVISDTETTITSQDLVDYLVHMEGRPWAEMGRTAKPLTQNRLARMLVNFRIVPGYVGPESDRKRGYVLARFLDAFARHLPQQP
jgi:Protein of unknown function (DUF3631)